MQPRAFESRVQRPNHCTTRPHAATAGLILRRCQGEAHVRARSRVAVTLSPQCSLRRSRTVWPLLLSTPLAAVRVNPPRLLSGWYVWAEHLPRVRGGTTAPPLRALVTSISTGDVCDAVLMSLSYWLDVPLRPNSTCSVSCAFVVHQAVGFCGMLRACAVVRFVIQLVVQQIDI